MSFNNFLNSFTNYCFIYMFYKIYSCDYVIFIHFHKFPMTFDEYIHSPKRIVCYTTVEQIYLWFEYFCVVLCNEYHYFYGSLGGIQILVLLRDILCMSFVLPLCAVYLRWTMRKQWFHLNMCSYVTVKQCIQ